MIQSFSQGLIDGFSIVDTIRDRRAARQNENRRLSLAEMAESRAQVAFEDTRAHNQQVAEREEILRRGQSALARFVQNPDAPLDRDDRLAMEQAGMHNELGAIATRGAVRGASREVIDFFGQQPSPQATASPGAQSQSDEEAPYNMSPEEAAFLDVNGEESLPGDRFVAGSPRSVLRSEIEGWLPEEERRRMDSMQGTTAFAPAARLMQHIQVPPGVMTQSEIESLPASEQEAAIKRNIELMGNRENELVGRDAARAERRSLEASYQAVLNPQSPSGNTMRSMAASTPTAAVEQYARDRMSLEAADPNTAALMDTWIRPVIDDSLAHIQAYARDHIPRREDGTLDFTSPEAGEVRRMLDTNIALLRKIEADFDVDREAGIRGGSIPINNNQLTQRVTAAMANGPDAADELTSHEERLMNTRLNRFAEQTAAAPARRVSSGVLDAMHTMYMHGRMTLEQIESVLRTGQLDPQTLSVVTAPLDEDLVVNGVIVRRGQDQEEAVRRTLNEMPEETREAIRQNFEDRYPGEENAERRAREQARFMTYVRQEQERIGEEFGITLTDMNTADAFGLLMRYNSETEAQNIQDSSWLRIFTGPFREGRPPMSEEARQRAIQLGVETPALGNLQFNEVDAISLKRDMLQSTNPAIRAAGTASPTDIMRAVHRHGGTQAYGQFLLRGGQ